MFDDVRVKVPPDREDFPVQTEVLDSTVDPEDQDSPVAKVRSDLSELEVLPDRREVEVSNDFTVL